MMTTENRSEWMWRDIFRSIGLAVSFSRLVIGLLGVAMLIVIDGLAGFTLQHFATHEKIVCITKVIFAAKIVLGLVFFLLTATAISYSLRGELLDGECSSVGEAIGFALKKGMTIIFTPVLFWVFIAIMMIPIAIIYLFGLIPVVGPAFFALGFFFIFIFSVLAGAGVIAFIISFFISPAIIATRQDGALDSVLDTVDLVRGKGVFWVAILAFLATTFVGHIFFPPLFKTMDKVSAYALNSETNPRYSRIVAAMPTELKPRHGTSFARFNSQSQKCGRVALWPEYQPQIKPEDITTPDKVGGWIYGIMILMFVGFSASFLLNTFVTAGMLTYLIVREEEEFLDPVPVDIISKQKAETKAKTKEAKTDKEVKETKEEKTKEDAKEDKK